MASALVAGGQQPTSGSPVSLDTIVHGVEQRQAENHAASRPHTIIREYQLLGSETDETPDSVVVARVEFLPAGATSYSILETRGSSRGVGIVRRILDDESQIHKDPHNYAVTAENYNFSLKGEQTVDGHRCYILALEPKRKDHRLVEGRAMVDAENYQIRLVEGELAHSPSFWLKRVQITMHYGDVGGAWTPLSTHAVADVRWVGKRVFTSRRLSGAADAAVAENRPTPRPRSRVYSTVPVVVGATVPHR